MSLWATRRARVLVAAAAVAILVAGCSAPFPELKPAATGQMAITASVPAAAALAAGHEVEVSLTQDKHQVQARRPVNGETFSITLDNLYIGRWEVKVIVWDPEGDAVYAGSGSVWIREGQTTTVQVPLMPKEGTLDLTIDIAGLPLEQESYKARLHVSPGETYNLDRIEGTAQFKANVRLAPGSYDFKVDFYTDSFHSYKLIYTGYWMPFAVAPGKTVTLYWRPGTGAVEVEAAPAGPPPAPAALSATWLDGAVLLEWSAVTDGSVTAYRVYRRVGYLARYELVMEVDAANTWAVDTPPAAEDAPDTGLGLSYVVTAVNAAGFESLRSPEAQLPFPPEAAL
ncbi:MAG TPA: hypothetical protein VIK93_08430 [Limnochordales bacterium]